VVYELWCMITHCAGGSSQPSGYEQLLRQTATFICLVLSVVHMSHHCLCVLQGSSLVQYIVCVRSMQAFAVALH
jgi:hypothetical protein